MLRALLPFAAVTLIACSGNNFELASAEADTGGAASDEDIGTTPPGEGGTSEDANRDSGGGTDAGPACNMAAPPLACTVAGSNYTHQFQYGGSAVLAPIVDATTSHAISYVTERAGRHEKMILNLRRIATGGATPGTITLTAYHTPCPGVHVPLGKSRSFEASTLVDGNVSFYFADTATFLPLFPAGTRLTFVLSTNSTAYSFQLLGDEYGTAAPPSLKWWIKKGTAGAWNPAGSAALPSVQAWLRDCP